jgi:dipeptidyl aminopeptidase/acylaminoacyl peptidase
MSCSAARSPPDSSLWRQSCGRQASSITTKSIIDDPTAVARANPVTYVDCADPASLLFHGDNDRLVSPSQTLLVHNALRASGTDSTRYVLRGANHGDLSFGGDTESGIPWSTEKVMGLMTKFLGKHLKR